MNIDLVTGVYLIVAGCALGVIVVVLLTGYGQADVDYSAGGDANTSEFQ